MNFKYLSAPCGSGKTFTTADDVVEKVDSGRSCIIVQRTIRLLDQTELLLKNRISVVKIHSECSDNALSNIYQSRSMIKQTPSALMMTWESYQRLSASFHDIDFDLYIDEPPQILEPKSPNISATHHILTDHLIVERYDSMYSVVSAKNCSALTSITENRGRDDNYAYIQSLAAKILSPYWTVYVNTFQYNRLLANKDKAKPIQVDFFPILSMEVFHGFNSVTFISANFENNLLYKILCNRLNVQLHEDTALKSKLRSSTHNNGQILDIYYASNKAWSKTFAEKADNLAKAVKAIEAVFAGEEYLWAANEDQENTLFSAGAAGRLPSVPHGLNDYQHIHNIAALGAYNLKPSGINFMALRYEITSDEIKLAMNHEMNYQILCRSAIRDINNKLPVKMAVGDKSQAEFLQQLFPGSRIHKLHLTLSDDLEKAPSLPKITKTTAERKRESDARKKEQSEARAAGRKKQFELARQKDGNVAGSCGACAPNSVLSQKEPHNTHPTKGGSVSYFIGSFWRSTYDKHPLGHFMVDNTDELFKEFKTEHKNYYQKKEDNYLITPALFLPSDEEVGGRTLDDVSIIGSIWLDNDGGGISENDFQHMFPHHEYIICNTYSSTKAEPKFRIIYPTKRPMIKAEYDLIVRDIMNVLFHNGYDVKEGNGRIKHGFDPSKFNAASMFYIPCQSKEPGGNRLKRYNKGSLLNPDDYLERLLPEINQKSDIIRPVEDSGNRFRNEAGIIKALAVWDSVRNIEKIGHNSFYTLGFHLSLCGMTEFDLRTTLNEQAYSARFTKRRLKEIDGIIRTLKMKNMFMI